MRMDGPVPLGYDVKNRQLVIKNGASSARNLDPVLIRAIAKSHLWRLDLTSGKSASIQDLTEKHGEDPAEVSRFLPLAWLAPDTVRHILDGKQPADLTQERLRRMPTLPISWKDQRKLLGFEA